MTNRLRFRDLELNQNFFLRDKVVHEQKKIPEKKVKKITSLEELQSNKS